MKTVIGEYGKIIILGILLTGMVVFLFGKGKNGFLGMLGSVQPVAKVGLDDSFDTARAIASRALPILSVTVKKLEKGTQYNLLDIEMFKIRAENEDGDKAEVSVVKIIDPKEEDITEDTVPEHFVPTYSGAYLITYRAAETYMGSSKIREKEYRFIAD